MVKQGTRWTDNTGKVFHVISIVEVAEHTWVHYLLENAENSHEYSCYIESFLQRFRSLPE
jgi:hypothetical protein